MEIVPENARLRSYELTIWLPGKGAKRDLVRGLSLNHALQVARNLYPNCMVEVPPQAAPKPRLARSTAGPREQRNRRLNIVEKKQNEHSS
jgi:hypothetical protein